MIEGFGPREGEVCEACVVVVGRQMFHCSQDMRGLSMGTGIVVERYAISEQTITASTLEYGSFIS